MDKINNLKIGTKILSGYLSSLILMLVIGAVAIIQLFQINNKFIHVAVDVNSDQNLAVAIRKNSYDMRLAVNRYLRLEDQTELDAYNSATNSLKLTLDQADAQINDPSRKKLLGEIRNNFNAYNQSFSEIEIIVNNRNRMVNEILNVQGPIAINKLKTISTNSQNNNINSSNLVLLDTENASSLFIEMRLDIFKYLNSGDDALLQDFDQKNKVLKNTLDILNNEVNDPSSKQALLDTQSAIQAYTNAAQTIRVEYMRQNTLSTNQLDVLGPGIISKTTSIIESVQSTYASEAASANSLVQQTYIIIIVISIIAVLLSLYIGISITRGITRPMAELVKAANLVVVGDLEQVTQIINNIKEKLNHDEVGEIREAFTHMVDDYLLPLAEKSSLIAQGDLTIEVNVKSEHDVLGNAFQQMINNLRILTLKVLEATSSIGSSTSQISAAISQQAATVSEQAGSVAETTSTIEEVRQATEQTSERTQIVSDMASNSLELVNQGLQVVNKNEEGMLNLKDQVRNIADTILALSEQTQQIGEIITSVNDIADQSNLLALNAAMEAARAGEAGRGFAIVASEVRSLAELSKQATGQVSGILSDIQKAANTAVMVTEQGTKRADEGVQSAKAAGETFRLIQDHTQQVAISAQQIASSIRQTLTGMDQITHAMETINLGAGQSQAGIRQIEQAAHTLNNLASQLVEILTQYKVKEINR